MATLIYEPQYRIIGWPEDSGFQLIAWFDRDLTDTGVTVPLFTNTNTFFIPILNVTMLAPLVTNPNGFFVPTVALLNVAVHEILKNEVRRIRFLTGPKRD